MGANIEEVAMNELSHYLSMASICRARAIEDNEKRSQWLDWADEWNELADEAIGRPLKQELPIR
jgi:hypothetical protein